MESGTKKIEVNALTNDGDTAFNLACWQGKLEVVKLLLEEPKAKGQVISKGNFGVFNSSKNELKISGLASKSGRI